MRRRGSYVLIVILDYDKKIEVGALGMLHFPKGMYCYVGSARGGLDQRLARHFAREKPLKWHIDYLTTYADAVDAYISYPDMIDECDLAFYALKAGLVVSHKGFGCSDCHCWTHLFTATDDTLDNLVELAGLTHYE